MTSRAISLLLAGTLLLLLAALVGAARPAIAAGPSVDASRHLWATVNICDTARHEDSIGVRASMPGSGKRGESMWMRFRVQYRSAQGEWRDLESASTRTKFLRVGRHARYKARQAGWVFAFAPERGRSHVLRGVVSFAWRKGGRTVRRATQATSGGHRAAMADPRRYSAATCEIVGG